MRRERPQDFADRLPRVVPRAEEDISHLSDEMADLLYPGRRPRPFRLGLTFESFEGPDAERVIVAVIDTGIDVQIFPLQQTG